MGIGGTCGPSSGNKCGGNSGSGNCSGNKGSGNSRSGGCSVNRGSGRETKSNCESNGYCAPPTQVRNANCTPNSCPSAAPTGSNSGQTVQVCVERSTPGTCTSGIINGEHRITICPGTERVCLNLPRYSGDDAPRFNEILRLTRTFGFPFKQASESFRLMQQAEQRKQEHEAELRRQEHEAEQHRQAQEAELRRLEHAKWAAEHPIEAAQGWVNDAINHINAMEHNKNHAEHQVRETEEKLSKSSNEYKEAESYYAELIRNAPDIYTRPLFSKFETKENIQEEWDIISNDLQENMKPLNLELSQRKAHLDHCHHQLHEAHQNKSRADTNLVHIQNTIRQQQEAHAAHVAHMEAVRLKEQQDAQRRADEAAEAQRQAAEAARLYEQQEAQKKADEAAEVQRQANEAIEAQKRADDAARVVKELIAARAVENNDLGKVNNQFSSLSVSQQEQRVKELAACETNACKVQTEAKWFIQGADQWLSYAGGVAAGIPAGIVDGVKGVMHAAQNEQEVYAGLKGLVNSGNILGTVADGVKQSWIAHIDNMEASKQQGNVVGSFQAGIEGGKLTGDVLGLVASGAGIAKTVISVNKFGSSLPKIQTVSQAETGMVWGMGIQGQGIPWESFVGKQLPAGSRLPQNYKTFDYFDIDTGVAVSVKTIDTTTSSKITNPKQIYTSLKGNIDATISFDGYSLSGTTIKPGQITAREVIVAIPEATTKAQWEHINQAIKYGEDNGVTLKIIKVD